MTAGFPTALYVHTHTYILNVFVIYIFTYMHVSPPQAIEAFALMVKTTAQTLQAFGTELAETELPNDAEATTNLLHTHTLKKEKMKVRYAFAVFSTLYVSTERNNSLCAQTNSWIITSSCQQWFQSTSVYIFMSVHRKEL